MGKTRINANTEEWNAVLDGISTEVEKVLARPPDNQTEAQAFIAFVNKLREETDNVLSYLPSAERADAEALCAVWMNVGILFGKSPNMLVDILDRAGARIGKDQEGDDG